VYVCVNRGGGSPVTRLFMPTRCLSVFCSTGYLSTRAGPRCRSISPTLLPQLTIHKLTMGVGVGPHRVIPGRVNPQIIFVCQPFVSLLYSTGLTRYNGLTRTSLFMLTFFVPLSFSYSIGWRSTRAELRCRLISLTLPPQLTIHKLTMGVFVGGWGGGGGTRGGGGDV